VAGVSLKLHEARTRAALIGDVHTRVRLDLTGTDHFTVRATITFGCTQPGADTFLELRGASDVRVDGAAATYDGRRIALAGLQRHNQVSVEATMPYVTDGDGMTVTIDPADGERYVCGYTAMDVAQKVIPCFDQPDLKSTFTVSVIAPSHWTVLANGVLEERATTGGATRWHFSPTPPISTYLFFVTGGPYVSRTWEEPYAGGSLSFGWHARASQERELDRDFAELRRVTSACFQHYTKVFDAPYAFGDYQQVFSPGLNWGAMEFPGAVAFRDEFLKQGTPTAIDRQAMASVIAHEMAHMWFGDLVTMRWWEDTWLNESFADYMGYAVSDRAAGYGDAWTTAAIVRKPTGYRADRRRSTHRVAEDAEVLVDVDTAFTNFDMITYAKGNAVLRQLGTWLGEDAFLDGVNRHLSAHAFGNATLADFLDALDAATDRDVRGWAQSWLRTTGFDTIEVTRDGDVPVLVRHGSRPHRFTVAAFDDAMGLVDTVWVDLADEPVRLDDFAGRVAVPNAGDETFAALRLDDRSWAAVEAGLSDVSSPLTRALLWWTAVDAAETGGSVADLVALAARHLLRERHPVVFEGALAAVLRAVRVHGLPDEVSGLLRTLAEMAGAVVEDGDPALQPAASRALAATSSDRSMLTEWLGRDGVDQEVRWAVVHRLASLGDEGVVETEAVRDRSVAGHHAALRARAAVPTVEAKTAAWDLLKSGTLGSHAFAAVASGFWGWERADLVEPWVERYVDDGLALARTSGQAMSQVIGRAWPWLPLSDAVRQRLRERVTTALDGDVPTVLARQWNDALDDLP
jgi:aminopeptidase N